jgi:hypothetical protein
MSSTLETALCLAQKFDSYIEGFAFAKEYRVYYKKVPTDDGGYVMDHSSFIYLVGPDGSICHRYSVSGGRCLGARQAPESCSDDPNLRGLAQPVQMAIGAI